MNTKTSSLIFAIVMVFSSFVGCIETADEKTDTVTSPSSLGNVIVSTYHVAELVRGVGGDRVTVEIISPSNVPVHDYAPSAADLIRLQDVDLFFYHGLNLEPWVDATISSLGSDAPLAVQTHAMPTGENTLDYQSMLLNNMCETLNDDAYETITLADHHDEAGDVEIHAEAMTHKVSYPEMDDGHGDEDDHDDHGDEDDHDNHGDEDDHDDHGDEDNHDDHGDGHAEHNHAAAEKVIENPSSCPSDTSVSIFHLEEGEYLLEFEYGAATEFDMVVLKMAGGHAHHGHDEHGDDHDDNETHDDHDGHDDHDDHGDEDDHDDHDGHGDDHHEEMTQLMAIFNNSDADGDGFLNLTELEHFIPAVVEFDEDEHGDHDGHDGHDDNETHDDDHDGNETHSDDIEGDDIPTPQDVLNFADSNNDSLISFDEFWHTWEEGDDDNHDSHEEHLVAFATLHVEEEGDYGFALPSGIEYFILMGEAGHEGHDDHDDHGDDHSDHSDEEVHSDEEDHSDEENHSDEGSEIVADEGEEAFNYDPHSWLNPVAYKAQVDVVLNALITAFPDGEADFKANAEAYSVELDKLDLDYTAAFGEGGTCEASNTEKTIVANHNAYAYIAERYDIEILTVHGLDPEGEPSAADIVEVVEQIEENNITTLYVEEYTDTSSVDSIVQQTGITIEILYTMELPPKNSEDTYLTLMSKNLDSLVEGMGC
jgi:zinc transport system substrate-binding protein